MRIRLAFVAITVATLTVVACNPDAPSTPDPCQLASGLPAYDLVAVDGSAIHVPAGRDRVRDASMDGLSGKALTRACDAFIAEYNHDH